MMLMNSSSSIEMLPAGFLDVQPSSPGEDSSANQRLIAKPVSRKKTTAKRPASQQSLEKSSTAKHPAEQQSLEDNNTTKRLAQQPSHQESDTAKGPAQQPSYQG